MSTSEKCGEDRRKKGPERKVKLFSGSDVGEDWFVPIWEGLEQDARVLEEKNAKEWGPLANTAWVKANLFYERPRSIHKERYQSPVKEEDTRRTNIDKMASSLVRMMKALEAAQDKKKLEPLKAAAIRQVFHLTFKKLQEKRLDR